MARRDVTAELRHDVLVDIPKGHERCFGTSGTMLKPSRASVEAALANMQRGATMTITELRRCLARQHGPDTACPFMTERALMAIAEDAAATAPHWRIVKPNGAAMTYFRGGAAAQTRRLKAE
jgi:6-O-methylguanine DNA methyltransferase, DNA binding domain